MTCNEKWKSVIPCFQVINDGRLVIYLFDKYAKLLKLLMRGRLESLKRG